MNLVVFGETSAWKTKFGCGMTVKYPPNMLDCDD
jgi:hypothetical protein